MKHKNQFSSWVLGSRDVKHSDLGSYVGIKKPSSKLFTQLLNIAFESATSIMVEFEESPDFASVSDFSVQVGPRLWKLEKGIDKKKVFSKWLYIGNWVMFLGECDFKDVPSFDFAKIDTELDRVFSRVDLIGGVVSYYDNTYAWVYAKGSK